MGLWIGGTYSICVDFDGTLVEAKWPDMGDWMPGAVDAMFELHGLGFGLICNSARLNPYNPYSGTLRPDIEVNNDYALMRKKFDDAGLTFIDIWRGEGKPSCFAYIDDRGIHYTGSPGSWRAVVRIVKARAELAKKGAG